MAVGVAVRSDMIKALLMRGYRLSNGKLLKGDEEAKCYVCGRTITKKNLGAVIPGSLRLICDNNECMLMVPMLYVEAKKRHA